MVCLTASAVSITKIDRVDRLVIIKQSLRAQLLCVRYKRSSQLLWGIRRRWLWTAAAAAAAAVDCNIFFFQ